MDSQYWRRFKTVQRHVDVIGIDLATVAESFAGFGVFLRPGVRYRVLLLDPAFPSVQYSYATQRGKEELSRSFSRAQTAAEAYVRTFARWRREDSSRAALSYDIRLHRSLPTLHYARFDDEILWGPYLIERSGQRTFSIVTSSGGYLFDQLSSHFEVLWSSRWSAEVPQRWLQ